MDSLKPPEPLNWSGNVDCEWRTFKQRFTLYLQALGWDTKPDADKIALLLAFAGPQAEEVFNTFVFASEDEDEKFEKAVGKFDKHCSPKKNETFERYVFRSRTQVQEESFVAFVTDLKLKATTCNFGQLKDSMIRDQIVFGINDQKVRERLLRETDLTLAGAMKIIKKRRKKHRTRKYKQQEDTECKRCGSQHGPTQCPAFGKVCNKCQGKNHYSKQCFTKGKQSGGERVHTVEETALED